MGNDYITANEIVNSKMAYRLPFSKDELRYLLHHETIFKRMERLSIDMFIKHLFPENLRGALNTDLKGGASDSSSEDGGSVDTSTGGSAIRRNPQAR